MAERDAKGKFVKGHTPYRNGRRPKRSAEESYLRAFGQAMPTAKWLEVLRNYAAEAAKGDNRAMKFFADYLIGKPLERMLLGVGRMSADERSLLESLSGVYADLANGSSDEEHTD